MDATKNLVERNPRSLAEYRKLVNLCLSRLIMFNAKRGGEASRMTLDDYENRKKEEVRKDFNLTPLEEKMMERYVNFVPFFMWLYLIGNRYATTANNR